MQAKTRWGVKALLAAGLCGLVSRGQAAGITWDYGAANTSWNSALNWSDNLVPGSSNTYTIASDNGLNTTLDADFAIQKFTFSRDKSKTACGITGGAGAPHTLTLNNGVGGTVIDLTSKTPYTIASSVAVALGVNSVINVTYQRGNEDTLLTLAGSVSGVGCSLTKTGSGALKLSGVNTYGGPTTISAGQIIVNSTNALGGSGQNVTVSSGSSLAYDGLALTQKLLTNRVTLASAGTIAMGAATANNLDFTGLSTRLGALTDLNYTGTLTPNGSVYKLGSGSGALIFPNAHSLVDSGGPRSLDIDTSLFTYGYSRVKLSAANSFPWSTALKRPSYSRFDLELSTPSALGAGPVTISSGSLYFNTTGGGETVFTNAIVFTTAGQVGLQYNQNTTFTGPITIPANVELFLNRQGNNGTICALPALNTQPGKLSVGRSMFDLSNTNQLPQGNFAMAADSGGTLFNGVTWAQFAAARPNGFGSGVGQWRDGMAFRLAARGTPVVVSTAVIPGFNPATYTDAGGTRVDSYLNRALLLGSSLTRGGQLYANAPVTIAINTRLSTRQSWFPATTGPGILGAHGGGIVYTFTGNISDLNYDTAGVTPTKGCIQMQATSSAGEFVFAGTNSWTGAALTQDLGSPYRSFSSGPGGMGLSRQHNDNILIRFENPAALPRGNQSANAYLFSVGPAISGYMVTAQATEAVYEPPTGLRFVLGGTGVGVLGASGAAGSLATLQNADVYVHKTGNGTDSDTTGINLDLVTRGNLTLTLGAASKPVSFLPTYGLHANNNDPGINAAATTVYDSTSALRTLYKLNTGTLVLSNVAYTDLAHTGDKSSLFAWRIGRAQDGNSAGLAYFDGAVRSLADSDALADNSNSLKSFNLNLAGGVIEIDGRGAASSFTRALGTAANQVRIGIGGGGFAAYGGDLTVNIGGSLTPGTLTMATTTFVDITSNPLMLGSYTADSAVSILNPINLNSGVQEVRVIDNPSAAGDKAVLAGVLSNGGLNKAGDGLLELAANNTYANVTTVSAGTLLVSGSLNASANAVTVYTNATLTGSGTISRPVVVNNGGTLNPGPIGGVGTLTTGNLTLSPATLINFQAGPPADSIAVVGALTLDGTLNVTSATQGGTYVIMTYTTTLTDNGLTLGTLPKNFTGQIVVDPGAKQVKLVLTGHFGTAVLLR